MAHWNSIQAQHTRHPAKATPHWNVSLNHTSYAAASGVCKNPTCWRTLSVSVARSSADMTDLSCFDPALDSKHQRKLRQQQLQQKFRQEMEAKKMQQGKVQPKTEPTAPHPNTGTINRSTKWLKQREWKRICTGMTMGRELWVIESLLWIDRPKAV